VEAGVEGRLEQVLDLFRLVRAKDAFGAFYKTALSRRLLSAGGKGSLDLEQSMVARLKARAIGGT
jgi:hypothetical protein